MSTVYDGIVKNLKFLGADGQVLTAGKSGKVPPGQVRNTGNVTEALQYFYHPDHLGSTSYVTDATGEVYQHLEYFAFGETFVEEHSNTDRTPYLFNGKELDEETGLYYYGVRYYDARVSQFLGVDPLADKYPMMNPFAYVFNNPLRYVDPTGMEGEDPNGANNTRPPSNHPGSFAPSKETFDRLAKAREHLSKVFEGSAKAEVKVLSIGGKAQVGPVKLAVSASVAKISGEVTKDGLELSAKGLNASGSVSFASAKGEISVTGLNGNATINREGVKTEGSTILDGKNRTINGTLGKNGFEMTADNSTKIGLGASGSLFGVGGSIEGSVNIGEAVMGVGTLIDAGLSYVADLFKRENN